MKELKFLFEKEEDIPTEPRLPNIFSGNYKFSTQNTAVYDTFALVETENEILRLETACDKVFYRDGQIALLQDGKLDVYENMEYAKSMSFGGNTAALNDLLPDNLLQEYVGGENAQNVFYFMAGGDLLKITEDTISFHGKEIRNTINESDSEYFVAHRDGVTVIGNSKGYEFVYFLGEKHIEPEECNSLSLRIDEELDMVGARDAKFHNNYLILKDKEKNMYYRLEGLDRSSSKKLYDCEITNGVITKREAEAGSEGPETQNNGRKGDSLFGGQEPSFLESRLESTSSKDVVSSGGGDTKSKDPSLFDFTNIKNSTDTTKSEHHGVSINNEKLISNVFNKSSFDVKNDSLAICSKSDQTGGESASSGAGNAPDSSAENADREDGAGGFSEEQRKHIRELKDAFEKRLHGLKNRYRGLASASSHDIPLFKMEECSIDCSKLYSRVFHSKIESYNRVLSNMIANMELYVSTDVENINQGIRYIDSKILERHRIRPFVKYTSPLACKPESAKYVDERMDMLIESMRIINVSQKEGTAAGKALPSLRSGTGATDGEKASVFGGSQDAKDQERPNAADDRDVGFKSKNAGPSVANEAKGRAPDTPGPSFSVAHPGPSSQPAFGCSGVKPDSLPFSPASTSQQPLFNNAPVDNPMRVSDTTNLFNRLSSAGSTVFDSTSEPDAQESPSGSAFSRLAGSRKMFK